MYMLIASDWLGATVVRFMPQVLAVGLAIAVAFTRALLTAASPWKALLDGLLCGLLTMALFPLLDFFGLNMQLACTLGAIMAFLGVDWTRETLKGLVASFLQRFNGHP